MRNGIEEMTSFVNESREDGVRSDSESRRYHKTYFSN